MPIPRLYHDHGITHPSSADTIQKVYDECYSRPGSSDDLNPDREAFINLLKHNTETGPTSYLVFQSQGEFTEQFDEHGDRLELYEAPTMTYVLSLTRTRSFGPIAVASAGTGAPMPESCFGVLRGYATLTPDVADLANQMVYLLTHDEEGADHVKFDWDDTDPAGVEQAMIDTLKHEMGEPGIGIDNVEIMPGLLWKYGFSTLSITFWKALSAVRPANRENLEGKGSEGDTFSAVTIAKVMLSSHLGRSIKGSGVVEMIQSSWEDT